MKEIAADRICQPSISGNGEWSRFQPVFRSSVSTSVLSAPLW